MPSGRPAGAKDKVPRKRTGQARGITKDNNPELEAGYNTRRIQFMMAIMPKEPLDYNDVDEMERRFENYLRLCSEWDMKVGNQAAYAAIGIDKGMAWEWSMRNTGNTRRTDFIKKVQKICAMYREGLMEDGKVNPVTGIFWQKNYDGLRDQQEVVLTPNTSPLGEQKDAEQLKQKYIEQTYGINGQLPEVAEREPLEILDDSEADPAAEIQANPGPE